MREGKGKLTLYLKYKVYFCLKIAGSYDFLCFYKGENDSTIIENVALATGDFEVLFFELKY